MTIPRAWKPVAVRLTGESQWIKLPGPIHPDAVPAMETAGHLQSRVTRDGRRELLEVRER